MKTLSKPSRWLLLHLASIYPTGIATTTVLPVSHWSEQPKMVQMRGLVRRGWAVEAREGNMPWGRELGIFYITEAGLQAAKKIKEGA